jgi:hypothetical protein
MPRTRRLPAAPEAQAVISIAVSIVHDAGTAS